MADPLDDDAAAAVAFACKRPVRRRVGLPSDNETAFQRLYAEAEPQASAADGRLDENRDADLERLKDLASEAPVIRLVTS